MSDAPQRGAAGDRDGARPGNGGDLLVRILRENGVDTVFGVVSVHNLPLVEAVDRDLRFVAVRHEAAAVNAADGHARAGGGLGCALTSTGTGAGNAAGSMIEALAAGSRVLHVTGNIDSAHLGRGRGVIHETKDQLGMLTAVSKHAATITSAGTAASVLRTAIRHARTLPYGPVSVEWPIDLQYAAQQDTGAGAENDPAVPRPDAAHTVGAARLAEIAARLAAARRPLIWAGGGARAAGGPLRALAERLGAPILTSNAGRGSVSEDHELVVGNFAASAAAQPLLADADLLLSIGTHFRSNETRHYALRLPEHHVQLDVDPDALGRSYPATDGLCGDAADLLPALLDHLPEDGPTSEPGWRERGVATRRAVRDRLRADIGPYAAICDAMRAYLEPGSPIARDVTIPSSQWGNRLLPIFDPATNIFPVGGGIGQGLAMGIGAALARPDVPALVIAGDGGLSFASPEIVETEPGRRLGRWIPRDARSVRSSGRERCVSCRRPAGRLRRWRVIWGSTSTRCTTG